MCSTEPLSSGAQAQSSAAHGFISSWDGQHSAAHGSDACCSRFSGCARLYRHVGLIQGRRVSQARVLAGPVEFGRLWCVLCGVVCYGGRCYNVLGAVYIKRNIISVIYFASLQPKMTREYYGAGRVVPSANRLFVCKRIDGNVSAYVCIYTPINCKTFLSQSFSSNLLHKSLIGVYYCCV